MLFPLSVWAQYVPDRARGLAATCANCHGTDGVAEAGSGLASLAGMNRDALHARLQAFLRGELSPSIMHQVVRGYTESQLYDVADYFAARSPRAQP